MMRTPKALPVGDSPGRQEREGATARVHCRRALVAAVVFLAPAPVACHAQRAAYLSEHLRGFVVADDSLIVIRDVTVIDGTGNPAREGLSILIRDGRLVRIARTVDVPSHARVIDAAGQTAIPGLVMMHEHLFYRTEVGGRTHYAPEPTTFPRLYLASGVTTIRTAGAHYPLLDLQVKRAIDRGELLGPDIDVTGPYLDGPRSSRYQNLRLRTPEEARNAVAIWADLGVTSVKAFTNLEPAALRAAVEEAHARGLKVTGHLCRTTWTDAIAAGIDNIEHGILTASELVSDQREGCFHPDVRAFLDTISVEAPAVRQIIRQMVDSRVALTATLVRAECWPDRPTPGALRVLAPRAVRAFRVLCPEDGSLDEEARLWIDATRLEQRFARAFSRAGGLLLSGTDPTLAGVVAGFGNHRQMELLADAGFRPETVVMISSRNGAEYLGKLQEIGTLEAGKRADLFLIEGRIDTTMTAIRNVSLVFKDGIAFDARAIINSVDGLVGR